MKAVFTPDGVTTVANASGINDAAAAVIVMSADKAKELGIKPMAKMINMCSAGVEPKYMGIGPAYAIPKCLKGAAWTSPRWTIGRSTRPLPPSSWALAAS